MKLKFNGFLALLLVLITQITFAQDIAVTGVVQDQSGLPVPGANVLVKGTTNGTQTDFDGKFKISAAQGQILVFSFLGMKTVEMPASTNMRVKMTDDSVVLEGVVVTAAGIKREKSSIGAATTTVRAEELTKASQPTLADAIKGKVAGVTISSASTDPGASSGVIIRGFSSLSGSNQPLYVIDGIPLNDNSNFSDNLNQSYDFGRGSGDINPDDIESITILKGASSTALYGSRAANGVIMITTKKGKAGKMTLDFSTTTMFTEILRTPKYQSTFGQGWDGQHFLIENGSWGPKFDGQPRVWGNIVDNSQLLKPYSFQENQLENFFTTGTSRVNTLSVGGGSGDSTVRLSYSNTQQDGIYPTDADSFERNTIGLSGTTKVDKFTIGGNLNYVNTHGSGVATGQGLTVMNNLMQIPTDIPITEFRDYTNPFHNVSNYYTPYGITNPYFTLNENGSEYNKERFYGSLDLNAEINKWSSLTYRFGLDSSSDLLRIWEANVAPLPGSPNAGSSTVYPGSYAENAFSVKQINHDVLYNLNFDLGSKFTLASTFGWNMNVRTSEQLNARVASQIIPGFFSFDNSTENSITTSRRTQRKLYGVYNSSTLAFDDALYLTGNIRHDWYSTLPLENQTALYGGANLSWVFTNTFPGLKDVVSYGKIRGGYGETGVDTDPYQILPVFVAGITDNQGFRSLDLPLNGVNGYEVGNRAANENLKPERRKEFEAGIELSLFKNRINIDASVYDAKIVDQILDLPLAPSSGYTSQRANIGVLRSKGFEGLISVAWLKKTDGFNWTSTVNYAKNNTIVEELNGNVDQINLGGLNTTSLVVKEGEPVALLQGYVPKKDPNGNIVVDVNGVPVRSVDPEIYGDTQYDYTMGIGNTFSYKGVTLDFTFDIRQGGLMFSRTADITRFTGNSITTTINDREPWIVPGSVVENPDGTFSQNITPIDKEHQDDYYSAEANDRQNVISKSFVKLREVIVSYELPSKYLKGTYLKGFTFSLIGRNLLLWTPESNQYIDPETSTFGTDLEGQFGEFSANPSTRSIGFSLKANF
jgi:TonB-linked SusC/RagA family outer membrane protein